MQFHTINLKTNGIYNLHYENFKIIDIANAIVERIPSASIETTPMKFQDARNYQVSSEKLFQDTGFKASTNLLQGIDEVFMNLFHPIELKDVNHIRYSNQNFLEEHGVS